MRARARFVDSRAVGYAVALFLSFSLLCAGFFRDEGSWSIFFFFFFDGRRMEEGGFERELCG